MEFSPTWEKNNQSRRYLLVQKESFRLFDSGLRADHRQSESYLEMSVLPTIRLAYNPAMPDRSLLHELVDSLPEAALAVAQGALEHFQTWPPKPPAQFAAIEEADMDRMRRSMRPGTLGTGGGGGGGFMGPGGWI